MSGSLRCGARVASVANFAPNAPQEPKAAREEIRRAQAVLERGDDVSHGHGAVRSAHQERGGERLDLCAAHLGRAAAEASVGGKEGLGDVGKSHHDDSLVP